MAMAIKTRSLANALRAPDAARVSAPERARALLAAKGFDAMERAEKDELLKQLLIIHGLMPGATKGA
ncbi:MAG TPA: hypothetical protein VMK12_00475 [Anaeromyxobacteraceae bacterium]|nr:hypothetical protein [Anaeromyxobacteraceae bacterium]